MTLLYHRHNLTEELLAGLFNISQPADPIFKTKPESTRFIGDWQNANLYLELMLTSEDKFIWQA